VTDDQWYEYNDLLHELMDNAVYQFLEIRKDKRRLKVQPWRVMPEKRIGKIWSDYAKTGIVRDESGVEELARIAFENIAKLDINTQMAGHSSRSYEDIAEEYEIPVSVIEEYGDYAIDENGDSRITDYAMNRLISAGAEVFIAQTAEEKVLALDKLLNIVHQRSDLASWFVEGGRRSLDQLSAKNPWRRI
jgi:hypothetical protein